MSYVKQVVVDNRFGGRAANERELRGRTAPRAVAATVLRSHGLSHKVTAGSLRMYTNA